MNLAPSVNVTVNMSLIPNGKSNVVSPKILRTSSNGNSHRTTRYPSILWIPWHLISLFRPTILSRIHRGSLRGSIYPSPLSGSIYPSPVRGSIYSSHLRRSHLLHLLHRRSLSRSFPLLRRSPATHAPADPCQFQGLHRI
jgi:hypothetical protein